MAFNTSGASGVPLTVLGGLVTEIAPTALPEGCSPDNQELMYLPGSAYSRPAFQRVFASAFPNSPTVVYSKSFKATTGIIYNLYFDSNGIMWVENFTNSPGTYTELFASTAGAYAKSITAFGREWIAISDSLRGADIPYSWDGQFLNRVTQDAPAVAPVVTSVALPSVSLAVTSSPSGIAVVSITTTGAVFFPLSTFQYFSTIDVVTAVASDVSIGQSVTFSGTGYSDFNNTFVVSSIISPTEYVCTLNPYAFRVYQQAVAGTQTASGGTTLARLNNLVSGATAADHNLQVGYQVLIDGMDTLAVGGGVSSIVIDNEENPGIAVVTTVSAHGLGPGEDVTITGVEPEAVGSSWTAAWDGSTTTMTSGTPHGLVPGAVIAVSGGSGGSAVFNTSVTVALVPSPETIAFYASALGTAPLTATGLTVSLTWPIPDDTPDPTYFEVLSAPTATTFQIQVTYTNGTWSSGVISFPWNGTFFVTSVPSATDFTYQQYGPNGTSTVTGTATPFGQCAPGLHLCRVSFQLQDGTITAPGPFTSFVANGGQYPSVSSVPVGPSNVVARILQFTGAQPNVPGLLPPFFYIATPAQREGQFVSTSTVIQDNVTTAILLDFSDNTLFGTASEGGAVSVTGNNLVNQIVLDGALGFSYFESRLSTVGQLANIQNLLNMHFGGGFSNGYASPGTPLGWTPGAGYSATPTPLPSLARGSYLLRTISGGSNNSLISQSVYEDCYGAPIIDPNTLYGMRVYIEGGAGIPFTASITSAITSFSSTGSVTAAFGASGWYDLTFSTQTPTQIPPDMILTVGFAGSTFAISYGEMSLYDANNPYLDNQSQTSYTNNPTGFDGVTGNMQPTTDTHKLMDFVLIRDTPYCVTQDPAGRVHEIIINPTSEPSGWTWKEVQANCGTLSALAVTHSEADDETASSGDDWSAWPTEGGAGLFDGSQVHKISQEIQPNWNAPYSLYPWIAPNSQINMAAATTIQVLNDPVERMLYFFVPIGSAATPSQVYPLSYRNLNSAYAIANSPPVHVSLGGKLVVTDNTRKWTHWIRPLNGAARMYRANSSQLTTVFFGGNFGNVYTLQPGKLTDDDFGQIDPYYVTFFGPDPEKAQALQLGFVRLLLAYVTDFISGTGTVTYTALCDSLTNAWPITTTRNLTSAPTFDQEFAGNQALGNRIALKIASSPLNGQTDNAFNLQRMQFFYKKAKMQIRGAAQ